jgi:hypothetical protein
MPGSLSGANVTVNPVSSTLYTVTGTNASGCTSLATVSVTVNPNPTITAIALPSVVCIGGTAAIYMDAWRQHIESKRGHADHHHCLYGHRKVRRGLYKHGRSDRLGEQQTYHYGYRQPGDDLSWQQLNAFGLRRSILCLEHRRNRTCHHCNTGKYADVYRDGYRYERLFQHRYRYRDCEQHTHHYRIRRSGRDMRRWTDNT